MAIEDIKKRKCLMCLKMFLSKSKGNRRCTKCAPKARGYGLRNTKPQKY